MNQTLFYRIRMRTEWNYTFDSNNVHHLLVILIVRVRLGTVEPALAVDQVIVMIAAGIKGLHEWLRISVYSSYNINIKAVGSILVVNETHGVLQGLTTFGEEDEGYSFTPKFPFEAYWLSQS